MIKVGIFLFDDVETLDFCGPLEVFSAANISNDMDLFDVYTFSENGKTIVSRNKLSVNPDFSAENVPPPDVLVIPGGDGTKALLKNTSLLDRLQSLYEASKYTFSVCSGARIPALLGWLDGKTFTTHHLVFDDVQKLAPTAKVRPYKRFVDEGKILTSAGVTAGIDLSLYLLGKLKGSEIAQKTAKYMEYVYPNS